MSFYRIRKLVNNTNILNMAAVSLLQERNMTLGLLVMEIWLSQISRDKLSHSSWLLLVRAFYWIIGPDIGSPLSRLLSQQHSNKYTLIAKVLWRKVQCYAARFAACIAQNEWVEVSRPLTLIHSFGAMYAETWTAQHYLPLPSLLVAHSVPLEVSLATDFTTFWLAPLFSV